LLHPLPLRSGEHIRVEVTSVAPRHFILKPYPFDEKSLSFQFPARRVEGLLFESVAQLQEQFNRSPIEMLTVTVGAN
jgi:hypothetical protein